MFRSILNGDTGALYSLLVFCTVVLWRDEKLRLQGADMKVDEMPRGDVGELAGGYSQSRQGVSRSFHLMGSCIRLTPPPQPDSTLCTVKVSPNSRPPGAHLHPNMRCNHPRENGFNCMRHLWRVPMAVHFECIDPQTLLRDFDVHIVQRDPVGRITTWEKSQDGQYYTHRAAEWARKAWFKAGVHGSYLSFYIVKSRDIEITARAYAYYHGHLIETFLAHFDTQFSRATASALAEQGDLVR